MMSFWSGPERHARKDVQGHWRYLVDLADVLEGTVLKSPIKSSWRLMRRESIWPVLDRDSRYCLSWNFNKIKRHGTVEAKYIHTNATR